MTSRYENAVSYMGWRACRIVRIDLDGKDKTVTTILDHVSRDEGDAIVAALNDAYSLGKRS